GSLLLFLVIIALAAASFIALVQWHQKIDRWIEKIAKWVEIRKEHLARKNLNWDKIPKTNQQGDYQNHPFAADLDITGPHSLLQLINTGVYPGSIAKLEQWLLQTKPNIGKLRQRQALIKELKPMAHFRDRLH